MPEEKINKYGFIHVGKVLREKAGLPKAGTDIPLKMRFDKKLNAIVCVITGVPAEVSPEAPVEVVTDGTIPATGVIEETPAEEAIRMANENDGVTVEEAEATRTKKKGKPKK